MIAHVENEKPIWEPDSRQGHHPYSYRLLVVPRDGQLLTQNSLAFGYCAQKLGFAYVTPLPGSDILGDVRATKLVDATYSCL